MTDRHGSFVWYELMSTDAAAAQDFYKALVGWDAQDSGVAGADYTLLTANGVPVSGSMTLPAEACEAGAKPGWIAYVLADDVDATVAKVKELGGAVHREPDDIPGVGRFAIVADPQGAALGLITWEKPMDGPTAPPMTIGHTGWHELMAQDWPAAFEFYSSLFGWTKSEAMDMGPMGTYQLFATTGSDAVGGMMNKPDAVPACFWLYYFVVDAIDAAVDRVKAAGGQIINGPMEVPGGAWIVQGLDPQGAMFALVAGKR